MRSELSDTLPVYYPSQRVSIFVTLTERHGDSEVLCVLGFSFFMTADYIDGNYYLYINYTSNDMLFLPKYIRHLLSMLMSIAHILFIIIIII